MKLILKQLCMGIAMSVSASATAGIISSLDTHTTTDGSVVNLSGLDWLSWDETLGQTRNSVENGYDGLVADGWRYATIIEYQLFMESVFDNHTGFSYDNDDGAQWIFDNIFGSRFATAANPALLNREYNFNVYGGDNECTGLGSCYGGYRIRTNDWEVGEMFGGESIQWNFDGGRDIDKGYFGENVSHVLVKSSTTMSVPEPATLAIFALGMFGLASRRFKKQS